MKKTHALIAIALAGIASVTFSPNALAFQLRHQSTLNVADANLCGDFNRLARYQLVLENWEKLPASDAALFSDANLALIEKELKSRFDFDENGIISVKNRLDTQALESFSGANLLTLERCYRLSFQSLFGFSVSDGTPLAKIPGALSYARMEIRGKQASVSPATVVYDRVRGYLYIHQEW
ncbi:MAG: hypothetical protein ACK5QT_00825 [Oligoflexia bacterium]